MERLNISMPSLLAFRKESENPSAVPTTHGMIDGLSVTSAKGFSLPKLAIHVFAHLDAHVK